ncbi:Nitrogen regulation protein NR(II) [Tsuneonella dongtanensis]|uniref:histidine kinase n=1 Tax=Tsuneonella dongtanensis TaxID=692370 RepID=A0A1B2AEW3_9SPHN|nr:ATP-binding protein [Tsuneonella dongtanensis]ANY20666.1 Nitrogen regulation protein NR(II) [Tsuneonella dongtanensis]
MSTATPVADDATQVLPGPREQIAGLVFAVLLLDPDMVIVEANPASEEMLGRSAHRMIGSPLFDVVGIDDPRVTAHSREDFAPLVARGVTIRAGDQSRRVNLSVSPLSAYSGWRVVTLSDAGQDEMSEESGSSRLGAPAILAHEIKNPLAAIRGAGQLIARKLNEKDRPLADLIATEVTRIASLIDRMQRIGARAAEPNAALNLHEAVRRAIGTVRGGGLRGVELVEEFDPSLPPVLGNEGTLEQVMINLLANARDACAGAEGAKITVRTRYVSGLIFNAIRPGRSVRLPIELTVSDNGPGIDPDLRAHVFEPFVSSKKSGQGLGLALVRRLVQDMDGRIAHERDERAGLTHFRIHLPVAKQG